MLSERERQALGEIERTISSSDPELAELLSVSRSAGSVRRARLAHDAVALLAALSGILCIVVGEIGAGLVAGIFAAAVMMVRQWRFQPRKKANDRRRIRWLSR